MLRTPNEGFTFQNSPPVSTGDFMTKVIQGNSNKESKTCLLSFDLRSVNTRDHCAAVTRSLVSHK